VVTAEPHRFTIDDYARMAEIGIFGTEARVELIAGEIVDMAAKGDAHVRCLMRCLRAFTPYVTDDLWLAVQDPVRLGRYSQPEPDLLVCRVTAGAAPGIPDAADTLLVVEVADSSLAHDRGTKFPLYGRAGIAEAWLLDLVNRRIERHTEPGEGGYRLIAVAHGGETLPSTILPGLVLATDTLLG